MKLLSSSTLLLLLNNINSTYGESYPQVAQRTFVDDAGTTHTTRKAAPKIMCSARTALSFHHQFKIDPSQIVGTYGNYFPRGSIGNMHDPDYEPYWPTDPSANELAFLQDIPTFSPSCYHAKNTKCDEIDVEAAIDAVPEKWIYIDNGSWHTGKVMTDMTDAMGNIPIFISTQYEGNTNPGCITYNKDTATYTTDKTKCTGRSLLDVIKRTNELANFLGIPKIDIAKDQQEFCDAASALTDAASSAQQRGIRVMTVNPSIDENNAVSLYFVDPLTDPFLRSYEELGVPIIHPGKHPSAQNSVEKITSREWFTDCQPGMMFKNCNSATYYSVDLYLVEGRRFFYNTPEEQYFLETFFPDKALLNNQIAHWPLNDGPVSYTSAARSFEEMTRKLNEAVQQYDSTQCVDANVTSNLYLNSAFGGLKGGDYACYNESTLQLAYTTCSADDLAGGVQMVTTNSAVQEPEFKPMVSNPVASQKTIAKQNKKTIWVTDKTVKEDGAIIAITTLIVVFIVVFFLGIVGSIIYCCCWKGTVSIGTNKSPLETVEEGTCTSTAEQEGDLPVIT